MKVLALINGQTDRVTTHKISSINIPERRRQYKKNVKLERERRKKKKKTEKKRSLKS